MGRDAFVYISKKYKKKDIVELLLMYDYKKYNDVYFCGNDNDYKYLSGVRAWFENSSDGDEHVLWIRTQNFSSEYDVLKQNETIRMLKRYCNAWFSSDNGKNRYFQLDKLKMGVENGCYFAIQRLDNNFSYLLISLNVHPKYSEQTQQMRSLGVVTPEVVNANVYLSFLCSIIEEYFRETFIALLRYSDKKEKIINVKLSSYDLLDIDSGKKTIEEAYASVLSFQNIRKIDYNFRSLDNKLDIGVALKKPYRKRKQSLYDKIDEIFERRHGMIHRIEVDLGYSTEELIQDVKDVKVSLKRVYKYICAHYDWEPEDISL